MKKTYDVVIVGGGVQGLSLAYNLAIRDKRKIAVIEKNYIGSGASGRNGEMLRSAFEHEAWIRFFDKSLEIWETLSSELDFNVMFTRCGYLILASSSETMKACRAAFDKQKAFGIQTCTVDAEDIGKMIPALNPDVIAGSIFQSNGGYARHDALVWGYARAARRLGVEIFPFTEITDIEVNGGAIKGVKTSRGAIDTRLVINAAGGHANQIASMVGLELPNKTYRLEMLVTEPLKPFLRQNLVSLDLMGYMHQTARGEFVGGTESALPQVGLEIKSTLVGLTDMASKFVKLFPGLSNIKVMRQWAGLINQAPDASPVIGPVSEVEGFVLDCGWTYGFLGAPAAGKLLAEYIHTGVIPALMHPFSPERFKTGKLIIDSILSIYTEDKEVSG